MMMTAVCGSPSLASDFAPRTELIRFPLTLSNLDLGGYLPNISSNIGDTTIFTYSMIFALFLLYIIIPKMLIDQLPKLERLKKANENDEIDEIDENRYKRSAGSSIDFSNLNVIQWISMMQEIYEKFDYNDIECQKRLICEVMQSPEYFGEASDKMRTGFEYARFLEVLSMPDDFREILDEYIDASERAVGVKTCQEYFDCPYSLKDSVKRNFYGNAV